MKMKKITTLIIISAFTLIGCGSGGGGGTSSPIANGTVQSDGKQPTVDVKYTLNGTERPTCHDADDIGTLNPKNTTFVKCRWLCGRYGDIKGRDSATIYVSLTFRKSERTDEGIWELTDDFIQEASPIVCRDY